MRNEDSFFDRFNRWLRNSITMRLVSIGIIILFLLIPDSMVESLIRERQYTRQGTVREIFSEWGNSQTITGPILSIPYKTYYKNKEEKVITEIKYAHFLPEKLNIVGTISPEVIYRSIYEAVVYNSSLSFAGSIPQPDFGDWKIDSSDILWKEAFVSLGIPDMRGIDENVNLKLGKKTYSFNPGIETTDVIASGISVNVALNPNKAKHNFSFKLKLKGSNKLYFAPLGKETNINLKSTWANPSFKGAFIPDERNVTPEGFTAHWKVLHLNRNFPQQWLNNRFKIDNSTFGVKLLIPVDEYRKTMRSAKYAVMFIALTFMIFFFVEILNKKRIHPFQYILVGLALLIFYTLLLSLSEYINFNIAYWVSAIATIALITSYSHSIFKNKKLTGITGGVLSIIYMFIFITLQLQDYALLMGSIGLFIVISIIMYLSRKINWYSFGKDEK